LDIDNKWHNYLKITGIINNVFKPQKTLKKIRIKLYNTLALPVLLYGSETWIIKTRDARRKSAAEIKYMRRTAGYTWTDYKTNLHIAKELEITPVLDKLLEYKRNWIQRVKNASRRTTQDNETLFSKWQKESWKTSGRPERVNKWPNSMTDI